MCINFSLPRTCLTPIFEGKYHYYSSKIGVKWVLGTIKLPLSSEVNRGPLPSPSSTASAEAASSSKSSLSPWRAPFPRLTRARCRCRKAPPLGPPRLRGALAGGPRGRKGTLSLPQGLFSRLVELRRRAAGQGRPRLDHLHGVARQRSRCWRKIASFRSPSTGSGHGITM